MGTLRELPLGGWIEALLGNAPVPAGGALALTTLAGAAALTGKMARLRRIDDRFFSRLAEYFLSASEEDASNYAAALAGSEGALEHCLSVGAEHLERAVTFLEEVESAFPELPPAIAADVAAASGLGRAAARILLVNLAVNLSAWDAAANAAAISALLQELKGRLQAAS